MEGWIKALKREGKGGVQGLARGRKGGRGLIVESSNYRLPKVVLRHFLRSQPLSHGEKGGGAREKGVMGLKKKGSGVGVGWG